MRSRFGGGVEYAEIPDLYADHDIVVHAAVAALDKVILEALASGMPVITPNSNADFLPEEMRYPAGDTDALADRVLIMAEKLKSGSWDAKRFRDDVRDHHALDGLVKKIMKNDREVL